MVALLTYLVVKGGEKCGREERLKLRTVVNAALPAMSRAAVVTVIISTRMNMELG